MKQLLVERTIDCPKCGKTLDKGDVLYQGYKITYCAKCKKELEKEFETIMIENETEMTCGSMDRF